MTSLTMRALCALAAAFALALVPAAVQASPPPAGATWTSTYITTADGEKLHTDVMRPTGATDADKTPVILVVSPYLGDEGDRGPVDRFFDFYEGAGVFERGYSVVQVSTRGTGGSTGCLDIVGPGEMEDVRTAVKWASEQPWSNGKVGMYGKSYDGNLGAAAAAVDTPGLSAVVAQATAVDRYRGSYNGRVRLLQSLAYPAVSYGSGGEAGWGPESDDQYILNAVSHSADCQVHLRDHYNDDPAIAFWRARDYDDIAAAKKSRVPVLMTAGYLDDNTNIGAGAVDLFNALAGPKRLWIGWWAHDRGNDTVGGRLATGREGWFDEVMRWYDHFLKDEGSIGKDPKVAAQTSDGTWYEASSFPPKQAQDLTVPLKAGTYTDDARNRGSSDSELGAGGVALPGSAPGRGAWTIAAPLAKRTQIAGLAEAKVTLGGTVVPRTNLVVNVYDVDPGGRATYVTRGARLVDAAGTHELTLWPTDWVFEPGHRIGVLVSGSNVEGYIHVPTNTTVSVTGGEVTLPKLPAPPGATTDGASNPRLERFRERAPFPVPASALATAS